MNNDEQRQYALKIFKGKKYAKLRKLIKEGDCCEELIIEGERSGAIEHVDKFLPKWAYYWALSIGDHEVTIDRVTESEWAYRWAYEIGDKEVMIDRITESGWAYRWATHIGDKEIMRDRITEPAWVCRWARDNGDREIMRKRITAAEWKSNIGEKP